MITKIDLKMISMEELFLTAGKTCPNTFKLSLENIRIAILEVANYPTIHLVLLLQIKIFK
jgi:hypothetical protein